MRPRASLVLASLLAAALGCDGGDPPPPPPPRDAGSRMDGGAFDGRVPPPRDAGPSAPVIDGVVDDLEWAGAEEAASEVETDVAGSRLTRLRALLVDDRLYVAVEGSLASGDVLTVYLDRALDEGVGVDDLSTIDDTDVELDAALSNGPATPATFAADFAFGTAAMPRSVTGLDPGGGWRELADPTDLRWLSGMEAPLSCGAAACEAAIDASTLGGTAPRTIALFARIRHMGGWTNQTLPEDDPADPGTVTALLTVTQEGMVDAGVPDGGMNDAGAAGILVDGTLGPAEWDAAMTFTQTVDATGSFTGNRLSRLWAIRRGGRLYMAVEATLLAGNAIAVYLDHDLNGFDGLASPTPLADATGALDVALSKPLFTPAELLVDFAWGTLDMDRAAVGADERMGWREVGVSPDDFRAVDASLAPTVCGPDVCETSIGLSELGVSPTASVGLFARLVSASSAAFSNQTLPVDDPASPELVSVYVQLDP